MIVAYHTARMNDDWEVACSDEEDSPSYMPTPETIVDLYNRIDKGETLNLVVTIPPRRQPVSNKPDRSLEIAENNTEEESKQESPQDNEPNEFDFDSQAVDTIKRFTPKRTPNRPQVKKVARMDNVCSNILKYQKLDEAQLEMENSNKS